MTEKLTNHWRAHNNAYPQRFLLSPVLRDEYLKCLGTMTNNKDKTITTAEVHIGVPIEVAENTPDVMVAAEGAEVPLQ
jgi:hypothetical protein